MFLSVNRRLLAISVPFLLSLPAYPQQTGTPAPAAPPPSEAGTAPSPGNAGAAGNRGTYGNIPNNRFPTTQPNPNNIPRTYFFSGRVLFDDGTSPNTNVRIERICGTNTRLETHTDSRGQFSFQLGQNMNVDMDASSSGFPSAGSPRGAGGGGFDNGDFSGGRGGFGGDSSAALWNCELRAAYPGYHSDTVRLGGRQPLDPPDLGVIVLHHLGSVQGTTISLTTALAPKNAQKALQKGMQLAEKGKLEEAQQKLKEATEIYPKYAIAWYALGQSQQRQGQTEDARKSYQSAIEADSRYVNPYDQLARIAAQAGNWQEAADFSKKAIGLNPVEFPSSLWYHAVASYQLKNTKDAERSARDLLKLDTRHNYPQAESLMGQLLIERGEYPEAASHLKTYLTLVPKAENASAIRQTLSKLDTSNALNKPVPPPQP